MAAGHEITPDAGCPIAGSRGQLREVSWVRTSILLLSSDGQMLMGQKDHKRRKTHLDAWHFPCGQVHEEESLKDAAVRITEEKAGLRLTPEQLTLLPFVGEDEGVKTASTGEIVWCRVKLKRFEVRLDQSASQLETQIRPGRDLVELRFISPQEIDGVDLIPGVREFLIRAGYIKASSASNHHGDAG